MAGSFIRSTSSPIATTSCTDASSTITGGTRLRSRCAKVSTTWDSGSPSAIAHIERSITSWLATSQSGKPVTLVNRHALLRST